MRALLTVILLASVLAGVGIFLGEGTGHVIRDLAFIGGGVALLIGGADWLIRGAVHLAKFLGVSPFFIGLTVVAFGTSAPELAAAIGATLRDSGELAIGNVVGSNIANICLILGVTALVKPIRVSKSIIRVDVPIMIGVTILASIVMMDRFWGGVEQISKLDGLFLIGGLVAYVAFSAYTGRVDKDEIERDVGVEIGETPEEVQAKSRGLRSVFVNLGFVAIGLAALVFGAQFLVDGAVSLAEAAGVSQIVIGLTLVAIGTSIPELAFSIRAATQDHSELALGNVIGSNVFNLLCVLGISSLVNPIDLPHVAVSRDIWVMIGTSVLLFPIMVTRAKISRIEGGILLALYAAFITVVIIQR